MDRIEDDFAPSTTFLFWRAALLDGYQPFSPRTAPGTRLSIWPAHIHRFYGVAWIDCEKQVGRRLRQITRAGVGVAHGGTSLSPNGDAGANRRWIADSRAKTDDQRFKCRCGLILENHRWGIVNPGDEIWPAIAI